MIFFVVVVVVVVIQACGCFGALKGRPGEILKSQRRFQNGLERLKNGGLSIELKANENRCRRSRTRVKVESNRLNTVSVPHRRIYWIPCSACFGTVCTHLYGIARIPVSLGTLSVCHGVENAEWRKGGELENDGISEPAPKGWKANNHKHQHTSRQTTTLRPSRWLIQTIF